MILIGQFDSPFVRRVGIAMTLYGLTFEHRPWSTFDDAEKLAVLNPLLRVPVLVIDDDLHGSMALSDSGAILDWLDAQVEPERALHPRAEPERHRVLRVTALGTGLADKAVALNYEGAFHRPISADWTARCLAQLAGTLAALDAERAARPGSFWFDRLSHADIAVACALGFITGALPRSCDLADYPALARHVEAMNELPVFSQIFQPVDPPV